RRPAPSAVPRHHASSRTPHNPGPLQHAFHIRIGCWTSGRTDMESTASAHRAAVARRANERRDAAQYKAGIDLATVFRHVMVTRETVRSIAATCTGAPLPRDILQRSDAPDTNQQRAEAPTARAPLPRDATFEGSVI